MSDRRDGKEMMDEKKYQKCPDEFVSHVRKNNNVVPVVSNRAIHPVHTVQRIINVEPAPSHVQRLVTLRIQAATPAEAARKADQRKHEHEAGLGHHARRKGHEKACC